MTAEERNRIRAAVSERAHQFRLGLIQGGWIEVCRECGAEHDLCTTGCKTCWDRKRRRDRRAADPEYRARQNEYDKTRRRIKTEMQRARRQRAREATA